MQLFANESKLDYIRCWYTDTNYTLE